MRKSSDDAAAPRPSKQALLAEVARLTREGLSQREIGERLGVSKSAAGKWQRAMKGKRAARKALDPAQAIRKKIARYRSIADTLLDAWRRSQTDKQVQVVETTGPAGDPDAAKEKHSLRTETQTGNASYLARAMEAENRIEVLEQRLAALEQTAAGGLPASLANLSDDDLEKLTWDDLDNFDDDQLFVIDCRLQAKGEREGLKCDWPVLTNEELGNMRDEQFTADEIGLRAEIAAHEARSPTRETERMTPGDPQPPPCAVDSQQNLAERGTRPEPAGANAAASAAAPSAPVESAEKANPPPLTPAEKHRALMREAAARKHKYDRYTDPSKCAFRGAWVVD